MFFIFHPIYPQHQLSSAGQEVVAVGVAVGVADEVDAA